MIKVYITYIEDEDVGEAEGAFLETGECLGVWSCNDASWRDEYFSGFLQRVGIKTITSDRFKKNLKKECKKAWGL